MLSRNKHFYKMLSAPALYVLFSAPVLAGEGDDALSQINALGENTAVVNAGSKIYGIFGSIYSLLCTVGVCTAVIGMIVGFVGMALAGSGRIAEQAKQRVFISAIALILIGGSVALVNLFLELGRM